MNRGEADENWDFDQKIHLSFLQTDQKSVEEVFEDMTKIKGFKKT